VRDKSRETREFGDSATESGEVAAKIGAQPAEREQGFE
jgi:hypothetical protein